MSGKGKGHARLLASLVLPSHTPPRVHYQRASASLPRDRSGSVAAKADRHVFCPRGTTPQNNSCGPRCLLPSLQHHRVPLASRARGHWSAHLQEWEGYHGRESRRRTLAFSPAVGPRGRVCQGSNPSSKLLPYNPSSLHPTRLPMNRPILRPPRLHSLLRNGSLPRPSVLRRRSKEPRCPRTLRRLVRPHRPTTTTRSRALCPPLELSSSTGTVMMIGRIQDLP